MPDYELSDGKDTYTISSKKDLSDAELSEAASKLFHPVADKSARQSAGAGASSLLAPPKRTETNVSTQKPDSTDNGRQALGIKPSVPIGQVLGTATPAPPAYKPPINLAPKPQGPISTGVKPTDKPKGKIIPGDPNRLRSIPLGKAKPGEKPASQSIQEAFQKISENWALPGVFGEELGMEPSRKPVTMADIDRTVDLSKEINAQNLGKKYGTAGEAVQAFEQFAQGLLKPSNIALGMVGGPAVEGSAALGKAASVGFGTPMVAEGLKTASEGEQENNPQKVMEGLLTAFLGGVALHHGVEPTRKTPAETPAIKPEPPKTETRSEGSKSEPAKPAPKPVTFEHKGETYKGVVEHRAGETATNSKGETVTVPEGKVVIKTDSGERLLVSEDLLDKKSTDLTRPKTETNVSKEPVKPSNPAISPEQVVKLSGIKHGPGDESVPANNAFRHIGEAGLPLYKSIEDVPDKENLVYHGTWFDKVPALLTSDLRGLVSTFSDAQTRNHGDVVFVYKPKRLQKDFAVTDAETVEPGRPVAAILNPAHTAGLDYRLRQLEKSTVTVDKKAEPEAQTPAPTMPVKPSDSPVQPSKPVEGVNALPPEKTPQKIGGTTSEKNPELEANLARANKKNPELEADGWTTVKQDGPRLLMKKGAVSTYIDTNGNTKTTSHAAASRLFNAKGGETPKPETETRSEGSKPEPPDAPAEPPKPPTDNGRVGKGRTPKLPEVTGGRNSVTDAERKILGQGEVSKQEYVDSEAAYVKGKERVDSSLTYADDLTKQVISKPRNLTAEETGALIYERTRIHKAYNDVAKELDGLIAKKAKDKNREQPGDAKKEYDFRQSEYADNIKHLCKQLEELSNKSDVNSWALQVAGREWSMAGRARQAMADLKGDYTDPLTLVKEATRRRGRPLSDTETAKYTKMAQDLKTAQERIAKLEEEKSRRRAETQVDRVAKSQGRQTRIDTIRKRRTELEKTLTEKFASAGLQSGGLAPLFDVETMQALGEYALGLAEEGGLKLVDTIAKVREKYPKLEERTIRDAISGYYDKGTKTETNVSKSELASRIRSLKLEARYTSQIEDIEGELRTGNFPTDNGRPSRAKTALEMRLANLRKQKSEVLRIRAKEDVLARERAGEDTRQPAKPRNVSPQEKELEADIRKERSEKTRPQREEDAKKRTLDKINRELEELQNQLKSGDYREYKEAQEKARQRREDAKLNVDPELRKAREEVGAAKAQIRHELEAEQFKDQPKLLRFLTNAYNFPRNVLVFGHGTTSMLTHAGKNIPRAVTPWSSAWTPYWTNFGRQFGFMYGKPTLTGGKVGWRKPGAFHADRMEIIESKPNYQFKLDAGLAIDPGVKYDEWQRYGGAIGKVGRWGNQGFDALKSFRDELFDVEWDRIDAADQTPERARQLAQWINHVTGTSNIGRGTTAKVLESTMFAPRLMGSRLAVAGDTARTVGGAFSKTPESRAMAAFRTKRAAESLVAYTSLLAANQAFIKWANPKGEDTNINFTNPSKKDWLKFKNGNGKTFDIDGNTTSYINFLSKQVAIGFDLAPTHFKQTKGQEMAGEAWNYLFSQASPQVGEAKDFVTGEDFQSRPIKVFRPSVERGARGQQPVGILEYASEHFIPIPFAGTAREVYDAFKEQGLNDADAHDWVILLWQRGEALKALGKAALPESVGMKIGKTPKDFTPRPPGRKSDSMSLPKVPALKP